MSKQRVTTTTVTTEMIVANSGGAFARIEIVNGKPGEIRLTTDIIRSVNHLLVRDIEQLKDVAQAVQELLKAVAERTG